MLADNDGRSILHFCCTPNHAHPHPHGHGTTTAADPLETMSAALKALGREPTVMEKLLGMKDKHGLTALHFAAWHGTDGKPLLGPFTSHFSRISHSFPRLYIISRAPCDVLCLLCHVRMVIGC